MEDYKKTSFNIRLSGELEDVDVNTFIDFLSNFSVAIHEVNDEIQVERSLKLSIKEIQLGSFDIFLLIKETFIDAISKYALRDVIWYGGTIVSLLANLLLIRQLLKGEKPKEINEGKKETTITNINGKTINIDNRAYKIFSDNQIVDASLGKSFDAIEEDKAIKKFEVYDEKKQKIFEAERDDFQGMALPTLLPENDTKIVTEEAVLHVFKVVFGKGYKWQFINRGIKISAEIKDENFYTKIDAGRKFSKGDILIVDLEITRVFDKNIQAYVNKELKVLKVRQHIPRGEQEKLFE